MIYGIVDGRMMLIENCIIYESISIVYIMTEEHLLQHTWTFYYFQRPSRNEDYSKSIHPIGTFKTCEGFWNYYSHIVRPDKLQFDVALHMFRDKFQALWEDQNIRNGGYITLRLPKRTIQYVWERLLLNMIGQQISETIIGAVVMQKPKRDSLEVWVQLHDGDQEKQNEEKIKIITSLIEKLKIVNKLPIEYTDFKQFQSENQGQQKQSENYYFDGESVKINEVKHQ